jgi:hypothetical protein
MVILVFTFNVLNTIDNKTFEFHTLLKAAQGVGRTPGEFAVLKSKSQSGRRSAFGIELFEEAAMPDPSQQWTPSWVG